MHPCVVLFSHHKNCEVTRLHLKLLRESNPATPVVPVWCADGNPVESVAGAVEVAKSFREGGNWHNCDAVLREWFRSPDRIEAERYLWIEWDCRVTVAVEEWYAEVWNADAAGTWVPRPPMMWDWFSGEYDRLPPHLKPHAAGIVPFNGVLLSRRALEAFAAEPLADGFFCELRLGTTLRSLGFEPVEVPTWKGRTNVYLSESRSLRVTEPGLWHPVKDLQ